MILREQVMKKNNRGTAHKQTAWWHDMNSGTVIMANGNNENRCRNEHDKEQIYVWCECVFVLAKKWYAVCSGMHGIVWKARCYEELQWHQIISLGCEYLSLCLLCRWFFSCSFQHKLARSPLVIVISAQNGSILDFNQSLSLPFSFSPLYFMCWTWIRMPCGTQNHLTYFPISNPMNCCVLQFALVKCAQVRILFFVWWCVGVCSTYMLNLDRYLFHILSSFAVVVVVVFVLMMVLNSPFCLRFLSLSLSLLLDTHHSYDECNQF